MGRWVSSLQGPYPLAGPRGMLFQQRDVREEPPCSRAIRVYLGVKSISSSWQHANERYCKRRPTSRMREPRDRTDNTRESTMPVSSAFLVCQAHVKARLRESPSAPAPLALPLSRLSPSLFSVFSLSSSSPLHISLSRFPLSPAPPSSLTLQIQP